MENKTIATLNSKAWYRLLKVLFALSFLAVLLIANIIIFSGGIKQIDDQNTQIECKTQYYNNRSPQGFKKFSIQDAGVYILLDKDFNYENFYTNPSNEYIVKRILSKCSGANIEGVNLHFYQLISDFQKANPSSTSGDAIQAYNSSVQKYRDMNFTTETAVKNAYSDLISYSAPQFDINPVYSYTSFLKSFVLANIIILFVFEALRRIFYYIVIGNINPKK